MVTTEHVDGWKWTDERGVWALRVGGGYQWGQHQPTIRLLMERDGGVHGVEFLARAAKDVADWIDRQAVTYSANFYCGYKYGPVRHQWCFQALDEELLVGDGAWTIPDDVRHLVAHGLRRAAIGAWPIVAREDLVSAMTRQRAPIG